MTSIINASTTAGVIITPDTSGNLAFQSAGANVAAIQSNGMTINTYTPSTSLITSGTALTTTSGTTATFSSIPNWVKRVTIMFNGVSTSGNQYIAIQLGTGSSLQGSGYSSEVGGIYANSANNTAGASTSLYVVNKYNSTDIYYGSIVLTNISGYSWVLSGILGENNASQQRQNSSTGGVTLSGALNILQITDTAGGTFTAGSINILYE